MKNTNKIGIILSFLALAINSHFSYGSQQIIGFVGIFLFGILHGANDLALINKIDNQKSGKSFLQILLYYIAIVVSGIILFYSLPKIALLLFILFSGYHFGEQHWGFIKIQRKFQLLPVFHTIYGLFILSLLFFCHPLEVKKIISLIIAEKVDYLDFSKTTAVLAVIMVALGTWIAMRSKEFKNSLIVNIFYLMVFAIVFKTADLIWAFAIYFVVWHSIPSIKEQVSFLYGDFSFKNFQLYFKSAFPYWIISLLGIALLYYVFSDKEIFNALFFSFLAAITFPHTIIIIKMQNKN